jgi:hypothetical protein
MAPRPRRLASVVALCLLLPFAARAQQGKVLQQQLLLGEGFTVLKVWGNHYDMGYAQGFLLADQVMALVNQVRLLAGTDYLTLSLAAPLTTWKPAEIEQELDGLVAGVKAARPTAVLTTIDLKILNAFGDWITVACRSHSAWGSFMQSPIRTLSTRRLDYPLPAAMTATHHHVLVGRRPSSGIHWVSLGWPGFVVAATAVNEFGTLASIHDYNSVMDFVAGGMPRSVLARYALTLVDGLPVAQHLDAVYTALGKEKILTSTFLNYYVPDGHGGVITCLKGAPCSKLRVPQSDYFGGQVLLTTNSETDGHSTPSGGSFMDSYYAAGGQKTLQSHFDLMDQGKLSGSPEQHRMTVAYRNPGDMTIWAWGALSLGMTPIMKWEFADLVAAEASRETGVGPTDGHGPWGGERKDPTFDRSVVDGPVAPRADATQPAGTSSGCSCTVTASGGAAPALLLGLLLGWAVARGARRRWWPPGRPRRSPARRWSARR